MRIQRLPPGRAGEAGELGVAVVIDVLRATSTACVIVGRGARALWVAATLADAARLPAGARRVYSELPGAELYGARSDNSPVAALALAPGEEALLVTTNGTRALSACARAEKVLAASFLNLSSTAAAIAGAPLVTLVPAGRFETAEPHLEDELCADALAACLSGAELPDPAALEVRLRHDPRVARRLAREPELAADLALALLADRFPGALVFRALDAGLGTLAPWPG